jgi:hypothetical protein
MAIESRFPTGMGIVSKVSSSRGQVSTCHQVSAGRAPGPGLVGWRYRQAAKLAQ